MKTTTIHRIILAAPSTVVTLILFLTRQLSVAFLMLGFDILGLVAGVWWLGYSQKLAKKIKQKGWIK